VRRRARKDFTDDELGRLWDERIYRKLLLFGEWHNVDAFYLRVGDSVPAVEMAILVREVRKKGGRMDEIVLSEETQALCERRSNEGCASCIYIASDFKKNGKLTDYPGNYPVEAKLEHIRAEKEGGVA
jgi:hypothetical protein